MAQLLIQEQNNAIIVPLEIKLDKLYQLEDIVKKLRQLDRDLPPGAVPKTPGMDEQEFPGPKASPISENERLQQMLDKAAVGLGPQQQAAQDASIKAGFEKFLEEGPQAGDLLNVIQMSKNPIGFMMKMLNNPYIAAVIAAIVIATIIYQLYTMHGGIFDLYFKRVVVDELIKGRDREAKQAIRYGLGRSVVITSRSGSTAPESAFNSFEAVRSGEMESIKSFQIRKGFMF